MNNTQPMSEKEYKKLLPTESEIEKIILEIEENFDLTTKGTPQMTNMSAMGLMSPGAAGCDSTCTCFQA